MRDSINLRGDDTLPFKALDALPVFATDREIAVAIVGKTRANYWVQAVLPALERRGFPIKDALHDGRAVPLVRKFYEGYFGITAGFAMAKPDGEERVGQWKSRKKEGLASPNGHIPTADPHTLGAPDVGAPGLKWIKRRASYTPVWVAAAAGYLPRTANLSHLRDRPDELAAKCVALQAEMNAWKAGLRDQAVKFDGTFSYYLQKYQTDPDSTYHALRPGSRYPYGHYLAQLEYEVGDKRVDQVTGIDVKRWHERWSDNGEKLAAAKMMRAVLYAAIAYGIMSHASGTPELRAATDMREILRATSRKLPSPRRREFTVTAEDVARLREAAHADGRPAVALAYALVFETTLRLWDVIGQWWPADAPGVSDIVNAPNRSQKETKKWFGLRWEDVDANLVLRFVPSKTSAKTGLAVTYPLTRAPMVMEELAHWPQDVRRGPMVISPATGLPYSSNYFGEFWRKDRKAAGLPKEVWARDLRASGITEGRASGATTDDAAKVAGHASTKTTSAVYDRAALEAAERFADARAQKRNKSA